MLFSPPFSFHSDLFCIVSRKRFRSLSFQFLPSSHWQNVGCYSKLSRWHRSSLWVNKALTLNPLLQKLYLSPLLPPPPPNHRISSPGVYFAYRLQIENRNLIRAKVCIENRPQSEFEDFSILAFLMAALWRRKKKLDNCRECFFGCGWACIFICICTRRGFLQ